jgi:hypothetical protein
MDSWIVTIAILIFINTPAAIVPLLFYYYSPYLNYPALIYD